MTEDFSPAFLIPVYNHGRACEQVVDSIVPFCRENNVKIIIVDDGNNEETRTYFFKIAEKYPDLTDFVVCRKNGGKGKAFKAGILRAKELKITHVLQMDADGQHDASRAKLFFAEAKRNPHMLICGCPEYDESAPSYRVNAHAFANWWCKVVTWNSRIIDSLCGFRIYPVEETYNFVTKHRYDSRMGFDIEILIKMIWQNIPFDFYLVKVTYPTDGISNFHAFRDNVRISWVFTKLFIGMLLRIPLFIYRKLKR